MAVMALLALLAAAALAAPAAALRRGRSQQGQHAAGMVPTSLLLVSSPAERKVSYIELSDYSALGGISKPLVDSGLEGPRGLAYDGSSGKLYVADPPSRRVLGYPLQAKRCSGSNCQLDYELVLGGTQLVVAEDVLTSWVSVDGDGNLYFTDQVANTIKRIDRIVLERLSSKILMANDLRTVTECELGALAAMAAAAPTLAEKRRAREALKERLQSAIVSLHQATRSPSIDSPGGVISDGAVVYWANQANGTSSSGCLAAGTSSLDAPPGVNKTMTLSNVTSAAYGVATTFSKLFFTGADGIYSMHKGNHTAVLVSQAAASPRGIVWDGDSTVYIADMCGGLVHSLACGREGSHQPLQQVAMIPGAFGLALIRPAELSTLLASDGSGGESGWLGSWWPW